MSLFCARVVLNGDAPYEVYEGVHNAMGYFGFHRQFFDGNGQRRVTPDATYVGESGLADFALLDILKNAVSAHWLNNGVLLMRLQSAVFEGLPCAA
ncbi:hypothetical protein ACFX59_09560 [Sphingomonas sp. NCPPB 2930]|uniref:hypothetical protein n=1 Tax=Sphingomonas sp. NCPPB 2930 TaxID=3162788 RepID=UPI0036DDBA29